MKNLVNTEMILKYLKENNLTKGKFCKACKISEMTFNRILNNESKVSLVSLFKISIQMKVTFQELFSK